MSDEDSIPLDKLVEIHGKIKARIGALDAQIKALEEQRAEVRVAIKDGMRAAGLTSVNTAQGRVTLMHKTRYSTTDWSSFHKFILEHEIPELLEHRISQSNMATFLEENPGVVPPGLNSFSEFDIRVTQARK